LVPYLLRNTIAAKQKYRLFQSRQKKEGFPIFSSRLVLVFFEWSGRGRLFDQMVGVTGREDWRAVVGESEYTKLSRLIEALRPLMVARKSIEEPTV